MSDFTESLAAKSDQLNAMDIVGIEPVITIRDAIYKGAGVQQPLWVYYHGDNGKPWKPSLGMRRVIAKVWGTRTSDLIGKSVQLYHDPDVVYAGKKVGGIRIRAMSHLPQDEIAVLESKNKTTRVVIRVKRLELQENEYPADEFNKRFERMVQAMNDGMSLQQVVAQCEKQGRLTNDQLARLEQAVPVDIDDTETTSDENEEM